MALADFKNAGEGWFNFMKGCIRRRSLDDELSSLVEKRTKICSQCPNLEVINRKGFIMRGKCKSCGCCFPMIVYAKGKRCPEGHW